MKTEVWKRIKQRWVWLLLILAAAAFGFGIGAWVQEESYIYQVYCVGDSITYGTGVAESRDTDSYPARLQQLLGERYEVYNFGVSGRTLQSGTAKPYRDTGYISALEAQSPDIVVLMLGSNDSKPQNWSADAYEKEYLQLVAEFKNISSRPDIYLAVPPEAFAGKNGKVAYGIDNAVIRDEIRGIVNEVAAQTGVGLIDLYTATENHPEYFMDGVHPNKEGNSVLAETVYQSIHKN